MLLCAVFVQGCSLIDEDLSVCGTDFELAVQMQLVTNLDLELETKLSAETDVYTRTVLHDYFSHIFTDHAHDIDISFYSTANEELVYSIQDTIDANQSTYTFFLPKDNYYAIALANIVENGVATLVDQDNSRMAQLKTPSSDTIATQRTGLFVTQREIYVQDTADQKIDLTLHMASSAVALVIDTGTVRVNGIKSILCGTAGGFMLRDSLFEHDKPKVTRMERITESATVKGQRSKVKGERTMRAPQEDADTARYYLMGCASFPSPDEPTLGSYYQVKVYVELEDGSTTETVLSLYEPLQAGELEIIRLELQDDGSVKPTQNSEVGASVTLDWKEGNTFNPEI